MMALSWVLTLTVYRGHRWGCLGGHNYVDNRKNNGELRVGRRESWASPTQIPSAADYAYAP